jgi:hypothetical protein
MTDTTTSERARRARAAAAAAERTQRLLTVAQFASLGGMAELTEARRPAAAPALVPVLLQRPPARPASPSARPPVTKTPAPARSVDPDAELIDGPPAMLAARAREVARCAAIVMPYIDGPHRALALRLAHSTRVPAAEALGILQAVAAAPAPVRVGLRGR